MNIAILTFEVFNELDSFIAAGILNRMKRFGWHIQITCPSEFVTSMNGVKIQAQQPLEFANSADVVLVGSGIYTRDIVAEGSTYDTIIRYDDSPPVETTKGHIQECCLYAGTGCGNINNIPAAAQLLANIWSEHQETS